MDFDRLLDQAIEMLQRRGRLTYRTLKRQFDLDDEALEDLKEELVYGQQVARDEDDRVLVWTGGTEAVPVTARQSAPQLVVEQTQPAYVETATPEPRTPEAERRQLTVLFCDLVESTALSGRLDPEDLREVIRSYQAACTEVIKRFDGHVAQLLGDGLLVYFGYPQAHEDDAQRAVRAGLGMIEAMGDLNMSLQGVQLAIRVGIHTGLVVVGEMGGEGRQEQLALGETPNIAARIQGLAAPDTIVMSGVTSQLVQGFFHCEDLGEQHLRGVAQSINVYRVLQETGAQSRLDIATTRGLTPLVGRESEVTLLLDRWQQAENGSGQVVLLSGEAGIGKSRLVQVLKEHVATTLHTRMECRSSPYYQNTTLYPITDLIQRTLQWEPEDTAEVKLSKLEQALGRYQRDLEETVPLFATLLSLPVPEDRYPQLNLTPQRQRQKTLETLVAMFVEESERQPVLFIIEDLHWTDPTTLEFLELLIDQSATASIFTLLTCRPEFEPSWSRRSHLTEVSLSRLSQRQMKRMIEHVANGKRLPDEVMRELIAKTDGVPLYLEEITKAVVESGILKEHDDHYELMGSVASLAIPATLHDSLMARLDRLTSAKGVAQLGAVIGRQFSYALLQAVSELDETMLQHELGRLVEAELVYQRGLPSHATYTFKHALIQDTAYESLLRSTRQGYHRRIAEVLEERFPDTGAAQPELLARHYTEAGMNEQAIGYWHTAGERAVQRSAHVESIAHLSKGLELLTTLPDTSERHQHALDMLTLQGSALTATQGPAAPEVERTYAQALALCRQVGETPQHFPIVWGLWQYYAVRAVYRTSQELGEQLLALSHHTQDPAWSLAAHRALGTTLFYLGELPLARSHVEQGIDLYERQQHDVMAVLHGQDLGVSCFTYAALSLLWLGYRDQAFQYIDQALMVAQELSHPYTLVRTLNFVAMFHHCRREGQVVQARAEAALSLATEQSFPYWAAWAMIHRGWARADQGKHSEGLTQIRQGLAAYRATGATAQWPYFLTMLAEAHGRAGQAEDGLRVLTEGLTVMEKTGERFYEAEIHRLRGELLLQQSSENQAEAESCFHQALDVARHQQAKSWELRAATSLAKLWQSQNKRQEAYDLLAPVYGWFTEGFGTADLQDANALLDELAG